MEQMPLSVRAAARLVALCDPAGLVADLRPSRRELELAIVMELASIARSLRDLEGQQRNSRLDAVGAHQWAAPGWELMEAPVRWPIREHVPFGNGADGAERPMREKEGPRKDFPEAGGSALGEDWADATCSAERPKSEPRTRRCASCGDGT